jgi:hypothetical protein
MRRGLAVIGGSAVTAIAIGFAVATTHGGGATEQLKPAAADMPAVMEGAARTTLGPDLGPARVAAFASNGAPLPSGVTAGARSMYVIFGSEGAHTWKLFVGPSDSSPTSSPARCSEVLSSALSSCESAQAPDGGTIVTSVLVAKAFPEAGEGKYTPADVRALTASDLPQLRVDRNVRVFHPDGSMTSVTEQLYAPRSLDFASVFTTPVSKLTQLATDRSVATFAQ